MMTSSKAGQGYKRPFSVGYFSSYDRGLECLLDMWPEIKKQVPKATLDIYYGWNNFDKLNSKNPEMMEWKWNMLRKIHELDGVTEHGRVDHQTLANKMKEIKVHAYPSEFTEIHCITALKAVEAGCVPVTTGCYALKETVPIDEPEVTDIYSNKKAQKDFIDRVVKAFEQDSITERVPNRYWPDVAKIWSEALA